RGSGAGAAWRGPARRGAAARLDAPLPRRRRRRSGGGCLREDGVRRSAKHRRRGRLYGGAADAARRRARRRPPPPRRGAAVFPAALAGLRRAIELDRFGIAAHVLAVRDGCTAERCAVFALLGDADVIKSHLKAQVFNQYVSRYAADWNKFAPTVDKLAPAPLASVLDPTAPSKTPWGSKYSSPSAASIPPVSIMNSEPMLPKQATDAQADQPPAPPAGPGNAPAPAAPKRPQPPAAAPLPLR